MTTTSLTTTAAAKFPFAVEIIAGHGTNEHTFSTRAAAEECAANGASIYIGDGVTVVGRPFSGKVLTWDGARYSASHPRRVFAIRAMNDAKRFDGVARRIVANADGTFTVVAA